MADGRVAGAGVDDDDLVGEGDAGEGAGEVAFFVLGDDGYGEQGHGGGFPVSGSARGNFNQEQMTCVVDDAGWRGLFRV